MKLARLAAIALALCACGGGSSEVSSALRRGEIDLALRLYDADAARDDASLAAIASAVLEREARAPEPGRSELALAALREAGTAAEPVLQRLVESPDPLLQARALLALAQLGDGAARSALGAYQGSPSSELEAASLLALDPDADATALREALLSPRAQVRRAALARLARAADSKPTRDALAERARNDPELSLRLAALSALARKGPSSFDAIEARLLDRDPEVRAHAAGLLPAVDPARAQQRLATLIAGDVTREAIEAANGLLAADPRSAPPAARGQLARALVSEDAALRGRAAVALMGLRDPALEPLAAARASQERSRSIQLCLALALTQARPERRTLLESLLTTRDQTAVQAATELARAGDPRALKLLRALRTDQDPKLRRSSVRALARDLDRPDEVRVALGDADPSVRVTAAAAILHDHGA